MNLYDILLARCICGNKSEESIVATPLEVTENGTYEAAEGYAYNPVTVNVGCDFRTALVSMVSEESGAVPVTFPAIFDGAVQIIYSGNNGDTYQIPIVEGGCYMDVREDVSMTDFESDSDNIQISVEDRYILVLGDGTLTYTGE